MKYIAKGSVFKQQKLTPKQKLHTTQGAIQITKVLKSPLCPFRCPKVCNNIFQTWK